MFEGDFDVVILCNSLPNDERRRLAHIIKSYSPSTPIIVLADSDGGKYDYGTVTSNASPDWIVSAIRTVIQSSPAPEKQRARAATKAPRA
jgi:DNA-binding NarL/FixJ family response regulator